MRLRCVSQSGVSCCVSKAARAAPQSLSSVWIHVAPSIARHRLKKKKKKEEGTKVPAQEESPLVLSAPRAQRARRNPKSNNEKLLALCSVRASVTQPEPTGYVFSLAAPNAGLAAQHCGHSGAMLGSLGRLLLLSAAFWWPQPLPPRAPLAGHIRLPPSGLHISCCNALRGVASTFVHLLMVINDCQSILI
jgi:hypothetical protein